MIDGGAEVNRTIRDSTAERQQPRHFRVRQTSQAVEQSHATSIGAMPVCDAATVQESSDTKRRKTTSHAKIAMTTSTNVNKRKRVDIERRELLKRDLSEQEQVARWVATRSLAPTSGPSAQERLAGLRQRLRDKQSERSAPPPGVSERCGAQPY